MQVMSWHCQLQTSYMHAYLCYWKTFLFYLLKPIYILNIRIILWILVIVIPFPFFDLHVSKVWKFWTWNMKVNLCFSIYLNPSEQFWEVQIHFPQAQTLKHHEPVKMLSRYQPPSIPLSIAQIILDTQSSYQPLHSRARSAPSEKWIPFKSQTINWMLIY